MQRVRRLVGGDITDHQLKTSPKLAEGMMLVLCLFVCAPGSHRPRSPRDLLPVSELLRQGVCGVVCVSGGGLAGACRRGMAWCTLPCLGGGRTDCHSLPPK